MGGSGSGPSRYQYSADEMAERRIEAERAAERAQLDAEVNALLAKKLIDINQRDTDLVNGRLEEISEALSSEIEEFDRLMFGGSVAKQTYVEGLSDVDSLVVLKGGAAEADTPAELLKTFSELLHGHLDMGKIDIVRVGELAVTVEYKDGVEIQLLPAVERRGTLAISSGRTGEWLDINPRAFAQRLSDVNANQGRAVIPAVKLAKAIMGQLPAERQLSGYHVEALAVAAFEGYTGPRNPKAMVTTFFESASGNVRRPITDVTGQSANVDEKLGAADSEARRTLSRDLHRMAGRLQGATSADTWRMLFDG